MNKMQCGWCDGTEHDYLACMKASRENVLELESLRTQLASAEEELGAAKVNTETQRLALEVVAWYFDQRRYSVSPAQDGNYYLHDTAHRYSKLIKQSDGLWWPSVYMALCAGRAAAMRGDKGAE